MTMKDIFDQIKINNIRFPNRLWRSATWEAAADPNGCFDERLIALYRDLAKGGVGTIVTGMVTMGEHDPGIPGIMRLHDDSLIEQYQKLADAVKEASQSVLLMQIGLENYVPADGRRSSGSVGLEIDDLAGSDIAFIVKMYSDVAIRAKIAGFDGVQIHLGHWCFLSRCLSPLCNHRTDEYGGDGVHRARLAVEILKAIRSVVGEHFLITCKINASDYMIGGQTYSGCLDACEALTQVGVDVIEVSANGTSRSGVQPFKNEGYFTEYAAGVKKRCKVPVAIVGGFRSIDCSNNVLEQADADFVALSRPLIREPGLIARWQAGDSSPSTCISCNVCYQTLLHQCIFNV